MWLIDLIVIMALSVSAAQNPLPASTPNQNVPSLTIEVVDPQGALIPKAKVSALAEDGRTKIVAIADSDGQATIRNLPPGTYTVAASAPGFMANQQAVELFSGPVTIEIRLEVGTGHGPVEIVAPPIATDQTVVNPEITPYPIEPLPKKKKRH